MFKKLEKRIAVGTAYTYLSQDIVDTLIGIQGQSEEAKQALAVYSGASYKGGEMVGLIKGGLLSVTGMILGGVAVTYIPELYKKYKAKKLEDLETF